MASEKFAARAVSVAITTPTATITSIHSVRLLEQTEIQKHLTQDSQYARHFQGEIIEGFEIETDDFRFVRTLKKGTICATVVLTIDGAIMSDGTDHTANTSTVTLSNATQTSGAEPSITGDGTPARYTLTFIGSRGTTGTNPTITYSAFS